MQKLHNFKPIYHVGKKLHVLMVLEIVLLVSAYFLIIFFYDQNFQFQQNNSIYQLNHTLLLHTNSVLEKLNVTSEFPLARIADRHHDPLLLYLTAKNHGGISQTDFYRNFYKRTNEIFIQFPDTESIFLFDTDGNLLDSKTFQLLSPKKNYSSGSWYQKCLDHNGKIYILSDDEIEDLQAKKSNQNVYASRVIYDHLTLKPICITLIGLRAADIPVFFNTNKLFDEQYYCIFDSSGQKLLGNMEFSFNSDKLEASRSGDYSFRQTEKDGSYLYHVSYSEETGGSYSVIRTPYKFFLQSRIHATFWIFISGLILISLNIAIFGGITQSINRPLTRLVNMCEEIGKGNFNVRIPCSPKDELSYLTTSLNAMTDQVQQLIEEVYVKNLTKRNLELQMLRSQINPHFLYNTLENMRMSAYTQGYQELSEMCLLLSKVLRYGVTNQSDLVTVREELAHLQDYTTLLKYCFPTLQVTICVDEGIMDYYMTKVLFQPLVENSVNHAASNLQQPLQIQIWGYGDGNDMVFVISDNGSGITKEQLTAIRISLEDETDTQHGIGLKNIHRRIRLYYGENYGLLINSSPGRGTSVTVRIPRQNK